ncbi:unnamed protein product [Timema podura]|uniref:Uncharacterized protein n=1 Tax=Timema podura TaxID=61482 RepID=A0ABN7NZ17_TIMPD|nr:unnamed protein product [Timema podura]
MHLARAFEPKDPVNRPIADCSSGDEWTDEAIDMFEELARVAKWELMMARVNCYKERSSKRAKRAGSPVPCVELYDTSNKQHAECEAPSFNTKVFDGATVIHVLPTVETSTLKEYSDVMFLPWLHTQQHSGIEIPATSQEEVDSRIVLHIISAVQSGLRSIMTNSVDTDVFGILIVAGIRSGTQRVHRWWIAEKPFFALGGEYSIATYGPKLDFLKAK